jgi:RecA-family ATPase
VTDLRYALGESDSIEIEKQKALMEELKLPIALMTYSGGKSVHAIVKVNAVTEADYREKVDYLYRICEKNGLQIDKQNKNPSRMTRMPGVQR